MAPCSPFPCRQTQYRRFHDLVHSAFRAGMRTIAASFRAAGGYPRAVDAIFELKKRHRIA